MKKQLWYRKELADLKGTREAYRYYKVPMMTLEEIEAMRRRQ